jgi:hypothetical protein
MKCCNKEYPDPNIINGTAYFVCSECGEVREIQDYKIYTKKDRIDQFEKEYGVKLPSEYVNFANKKDSWVVKLPAANTESTKYYFGEGYYQITRFYSLDPNEAGSVFDSAYLIETWDLPKELVLIDGDGHTWLALDYRDLKKIPRVIVIESDEGNSLVVADNFKEFISTLLPYDSVYDDNGAIIYNGKST